MVMPPQGDCDAMSRGFIYTNEKCIGCNKCVRICAAVGASISSTVSGSSVINIDRNRCINCGACFEACDRDARSYYDDTAKFFQDLEQGEEIALFVAPAFAARYPLEYRRILGGLKAMGVKRILSVSFGADICTWAYLQHIRKEGPVNRISTTCPVITAFVEHCAPGLIPSLMPVLSPMLCAAVYCRTKLHMTEKFAFLGPCIAKKMEMDNRPDLMSYNVTFDRLFEYAQNHQIFGGSVEPEPAAGLGNFYPAPGGLADNIRWFLEDDVPIRVISGKRYALRWLRNSREWFAQKDVTYALIDALNCQEGCIEGTAAKSSREMDTNNDSLFVLNTIRKKSKSDEKDSPWNPSLSPAQRLANLDRQFADLKVEDYRRDFRDESDVNLAKPLRAKEREEIFLSMYKTTEAERMVNCSACGYQTCEAMVEAIHNGFNTKDNCIYYRHEEAIRLERMSFYDQLTNVMNRNALESRRKGGLQPGEPLSLIVCDVNGLKQLNDTQGHIEGDRLIRNAAQLLAMFYGETNVFRVGGDEFLVLRKDMTERELENSLYNLRAKMAETNVSMALGAAVTKIYDGDFKKLQCLADARMYEDKESYYQATGAERRI